MLYQLPDTLKGAGNMVTYSDLFTFVIMLCAVITLVVTIIGFILPAARCALAIGSLVKYIIVN